MITCPSGLPLAFPLWGWASLEDGPGQVALQLPVDASPCLGWGGQGQRQAVWGTALSPVLSSLTPPCYFCNRKEREPTGLIMQMAKTYLVSAVRKTP